MNKFYSFLFLSFIAFSAKAQISTMNPGICMVTVDDSSKHNIVYYDKHQFGPGVADSFILHREMNGMPGMYQRIMANDTTAFSMFLDMDTAGDPNIKLHRYKLQIWNHIGGYSQLGPYHTVLYCLQSVQNYNWNQYDVEGIGTGTVAKYMLLQDDNSTNAWHVIDSVSGSSNSTVDPNVGLYPNGQWRLATSWGVSCSPTARQGGNNSTQTTIIKSKSNITNNKSAGINSVLKASGFVLFPNPATDVVTLRMNFPVAENTNVKIYNALGMQVYSNTLMFAKDELKIPVSGFEKGIHFAELSNKQAKVTKKFVVE
ncbi:MAG: T9SS type A sorting domain-containing protein [Bacteroidia bacterium]